MEGTASGRLSAEPSALRPVHDSAVEAPEGRRARIDDAIEIASTALRENQADDGHWVYPLEADVTIPAEYILLEHFIDDIDPGVEQSMASYIRNRQNEGGGWPLFHDGDVDLSASVKAYYALKCVGDDPEAPHMRKARAAILARGGAARCNVFTRITLALFGQLPWRSVPLMPLEIMLLPRWSPFHLDKVSYWSRAVIVPLLILMSRKPAAVNPRGAGISELLASAPDRPRKYVINPTGAVLGTLFLALDRALRLGAPLAPRAWKDRALDDAVAFVEQRLNGDQGLGGIFPAMANAVMAFHILGYDKDHPSYRNALAAIRSLPVHGDGEAFCQPCVSPIWDTALATHAMLEAGGDENETAARRAARWLADQQIEDVLGDWAVARPDLVPGGWAFQYRNDHYPDTDDSAAVIMAIDRAAIDDSEATLARGTDWVIGMQSADGGWGSFDADNTARYLNHIPFADHGALLDPPSADVTARCVGMMAQRGYQRDHPALARGIAFLIGEQEADGSWFGRWGTNYIYGTWSALSAFNAVGDDMGAPGIRRAVDWLQSRQRPDGGWGEDGSTYWPNSREVAKASTPSQTAWALLALMAAGEVESDAVERGIDYLLDATRTQGRWAEDYYNAVGFPRVFFLKYHGYSAYFPIWALARYRRLRDGNTKTHSYGL